MPPKKLKTSRNYLGKRSFLPKFKFDLLQRYPLKLWIPYVLMVILFFFSIILVNQIPSSFANIIDLGVKVLIGIGTVIAGIILVAYLNKIRILKFFIVSILLALLIYLVYKFIS
jgi:hypothetical protein